MTDEWTYTNAEHTEARKGRWTVKPFGAAWSRHKFSLWHDDFPASLYGDADSDTEWNALLEFRRVMRDFLAWHTAQPAPIAVGDYVRLVGDRWGGEHQPDAGTCHEVKGIYPNDGQPYFDWGTARMFTHPDEYERITVTADLDEPWNLPMPEVGEHGWFYSRGTGHVSGLVSNSVGRAVYVDGFGYVGSFLRTVLSDYQITAWGTYDPADLTPAEPTTFGYVGYVTDADGDVWDVTRDCDKSTQEDKRHRPYAVVSRADGSRSVGMSWSWLTDNYGTFTAVERFEHCGKGPCAQENGHDGECKC